MSYQIESKILKLLSEKPMKPRELYHLLNTDAGTMNRCIEALIIADFVYEVDGILYLCPEDW